MSLSLSYSSHFTLKGLTELLEEGAVQMLRDRGDDGNGTPILAAVGQLQFEVVEYRLRGMFLDRYSQLSHIPLLLLIEIAMVCALLLRMQLSNRFIVVPHIDCMSCR